MTGSKKMLGKNTKFNLALLGSAATIACLATPAQAQDAAEAAAAQTTAPPANAPDGSFDIVVTAQKRSERLVEAPVTVTVLNSQRLEQLGATGLEDVAAFTPGLTITSSGSSEQIILRGVSQGTSFSPLVAIIVDGASIGSSTGLALGGIVVPHLNLADVERLEVLSGPQSTLYGASSMGGVISYVTKSGLNDPLGAELYLEDSATRYGQWNYLARGSVSIPLATDVAALRVSGFYQRDGAFLDNALTGDRNVNRKIGKGGRVALALAPADGLTMKFSASIEEEDRTSSDTVVHSFATGKPIVAPLDQGHLTLQPANRKYQIYNGSINWDLGPVVLDSITAYSRVKSVLVTDFTAAPFGTFITGAFGATGVSTFSIPLTKKFSQELRISSPNPTGLRWMAGLYYTNEDSLYRIPLIGYDANGEVIPGADPAYRLTTPSTLKSYAAFANVTVPLTDKLEVTVGGRQTKTKQSTSGVADGTLAPVLGGTTPEQRISENHFDYLATARYEFSRSTYAYLRMASGFRPGGTNSNIAGIPPSFGSDTIVNYEAGLKSILADGRVSFELAAFHIDWSDIQLQSFMSGFAFFANTGKARIDGINFAAQVRPVSGLTVTGNLAYTDARLTRDAPEVGGLKGEQLPNTSKFSGSVTAEYKLPIGDDWSAVLGGNYSYTGKRHASFDNSVTAPQFDLDAYSMLDLYLGMENDNFRLTGFIRNVGDVRGKTSAFTSFGVADVGITRPRQIGVSVSTQF